MDALTWMEKTPQADNPPLVSPLNASCAIDRGCECLRKVLIYKMQKMHVEKALNVLDSVITMFFRLDRV